jgi:EpsI family protein
MSTALRVRIVLLVLVGLGILAQFQMERRAAGPAPRANLAAIPLRVGQFAGRDNPLQDAVQDVLQASQTANHDYSDGRDDYWLFVGYFNRQRFGSQIHSPRHCYPGSGWNVIGSTTSNRLGGPSGELTIQRDKERRVVLYNYRTRGGDTTSEWRLKLEMALGSLLGRPCDAAFIRYSTAVRDGESDSVALERLGGFARRLAPEIGPALPF